MVTRSGNIEDSCQRVAERKAAQILSLQVSADHHSQPEELQELVSPEEREAK